MLVLDSAMYVVFNTLLQLTLNEASCPNKSKRAVAPKSAKPYDGNFKAPKLSGSAKSESVIP